MNYRAEHVDTDKALKYLRGIMENTFKQEHDDKDKIGEYYKGLRKGLDIAIDIFMCSNYEKDKNESETENDME